MRPFLDFVNVGLAALDRVLRDWRRGLPQPGLAHQGVDPRHGQRAAPLISADSHGASTLLMPMMAHAMRHPMPYRAITPPPPRIPRSILASLPLRVISQLGQLQLVRLRASTPAQTSA